MSRKAIFLDIDGTILSDDHNVPRINKAMMHRAIDEGHTVVINTGRPVKGALHIVDKLEFTKPGCYLLSYNGSILYDCNKREIVDMKTLDADRVIPVLKAAIDEGIHCHTYDDNQILVPLGNDTELDFYRTITRLPYQENVPFEEFKNYNLQKVMLIDLEDHEKLERFKEKYENTFSDYFQCFFSDVRYLEFVKRGVNKGTAIYDFCDRFGIDRENTIAVGDEENDIDMIKSAYIGVAMKNAKDTVKAVADVVTERDNNQGGVAEIIEKYMLCN